MSSVPTKNRKLIAWVDEIVKLCKPANVHWCDGSQAEYDTLCAAMVKAGTFTPLNPKLKPGSFLARSHPATWHAWKTGRTSVPRRRKRPDPRTTGLIRWR